MNNQHGALSARNYLPELDGLRAIAILLVISTHVGSRLLHTLNGRLGVVLFFVLSGYLITSLALKEETASGVMSLRAFYIRRAFRIFPLYYLVLGMYYFLIIGINIAPEKRQIFINVLPFYLSYLQEVPFLDPRHWFGDKLPFYQSWSLGIEEKFYLVWPMICFVVLKTRHALRVPVTIVLIGGATLNVYTRPYAQILIGCIMAILLPTLKRRLESVRFGLGVSLTLLVVAHIFIGQVTWKLGDTIYAIFSAVFLSFLLCSSGLIKQILSFGPLTFIGKISYGMYLIHILCISALRGHINNPIIYYAVVMLLTIGVATVLHFAIETPLIKMGKRLASKYSVKSQKLKTNGILSAPRAC